MNSDNQQKLTFWQTFKSVFWAAFGVQKHQIWHRDMHQGSIPAFIAAVVVFLLLFIGGISLVVNWVISASG